MSEAGGPARLEGLHRTFGDVLPGCGDPDTNCRLPDCDLSAEPDDCLQCLTWGQEQRPPGLENLGVCGVPPF